MKTGKIFLIFLALSLLPAAILSAFSFYDLNLSNDDRLLFGAEFESQRSLFIASLSDSSMQQLTAYPERLQIIDSGRAILAINRFGAARIPTVGGLPVPLPGYPSFAERNVPLRGRMQDLAASADGRWVLYVEPVSPAYGNLLLINTSNGAKHLVSERVELPSVEFPAKWSPDSRLFVYSKGGRLYYFPIISNLSALIDERFRLMGTGGVSSVLWGQQGDFYYFSGNTLYQIINQELFTRTIYGDFLSIGNVAATFPFDFNPGFDRYWTAPDAGSILIEKFGKGFFIFLLGDNQIDGNVLPHITVPTGAENINVFWSDANAAAVAARTTSLLMIIYTLQDKTHALRFGIHETTVANIHVRTAPLSSAGALSPDGLKAVFWGNNGLELWDYANWQPLQRLRSEPVLSCAWINNSRIISGNNRFIEEINISGSSVTQRRICLSTAEESGFEENLRSTPRILARVGTDWFVTDGRSAWIAIDNPQVRQVSLSTDRYRVYLESQSSAARTANFSNIPMIRNIQSTGTKSLVSGYLTNNAYPSAAQMRIALCFDLYNDDTGLLQVLDALRRCNIKATFFLNGDFIRRNPRGAAAIAAAGHETASMFYAPIDFSDTRYRITREFVSQGLARNEDEFFNVTGKELSLLWHPPYYRSSDLINSAASAAGYITVTRTLDPGDWMSREDAVRLNVRQLSASAMIEQIIARKTPGAIVPVRLGLLPGGREEYLYQRIDVLLDALIRSGCDIVPVSAVIGR